MPGFSDGPIVASKEFDDFEAVHMDPYLKNVLDDVYTFNVLMKSEPVTYEQLTEIVNEIDEAWVKLLGESATLTGFASFLDEYDQSESTEPIRSMYENQSVFLRGVVAREIEGSSSRSGNTLTDDDMSTYELRIGLAREGIGWDGSYLELKGSMAVEDIVSLEFDGKMSVERAGRWLEYFYPDIIEEIDIQILNESTDECEMIMRLAKSKWRLDRPGMDINEKFIAMTEVALQIYIESLFDFDQYIPYEVHAKGNAWLYTSEDETRPVNFTATAPATTVSVLWTSAPGDKENTVRPHLKMILHCEDKDSAPIQMAIPLKSIKSFSSIRGSFFAEDNSDG